MLRHQLKTLYSAESISNKKKVRVFGYDASKTEEIIKYFSSLGDMLEAPFSQGNWITFHYVSHETALKAIECNGMIIDQDHMVGVTWDERAKEVEVLRLPQHTSDLYSSPFSSTHKQSQQTLQSTGNANKGFFDRLRENLMGW
ncbi:uncharacterized protein B0P05DRAFT_528027 [Gilbertella persicaria]|uniref:uncharacterized protein n=1 Tax=Gilbertella persicaria TaxID=101096 RepID=UPI002220705B|nr:uncharacterized protein B0P05DRAFT_528027 [Gilbertella persicaria]KAI8090933.1 hypothetical protein B0P05DRAFT_528027 [Gilbertella persicaria]